MARLRRAVHAWVSGRSGRVTASRWVAVRVLAGLVGAVGLVVSSWPAGSASATYSLRKPAVPTGGVYLGAFVDPNAWKTSTEMQQIPAFQKRVGRSMGIYSYYTNFTNPPAPQVLSAIRSYGAIPFISWHCYDVTAVASGAEDSVISYYASHLKSYGGPILMRWYWEMNNPFSEAGINAGCNGYSNPIEYVAAWKHIYTVFQSAGATNVAFVWNPTAKKVATAWYPGSRYVNWIGGDGYDRTNTGAAAFATYFATFYATYALNGKPLLVGETGAAPSDQRAYLWGVARQLPTLYPDIKALVYFDGSTGSNWVLAGNGMSAFTRIAARPYFNG